MLNLVLQRFLPNILKRTVPKPSKRLRTSISPVKEDPPLDLGLNSSNFDDIEHGNFEHDEAKLIEKRNAP